MDGLPSTIGAYRILCQLGEGGMGAVFQAVHQSIERHVAIKVLHPEFAKKPEFIARFFNEARAVNRVDHPGLVQISDYGQLPDGSAYIVMEYLKGESLGGRMKRLGGAMAPAEVVRLGSLIADSLAAAHSKGIVHRDLKPDNVMIVADPDVPGGERTKLLDFGIAKLNEGESHAKTRTDALMGTPMYMSPEQCRGAGKVDDRSDVYSLGVMLFVMLSGKPPFDGEGPGDIIAKHLFLPSPRLEEVVPDAPKPLADLVWRLMQKDKQARPSMREVAAELRAIAEGLPAFSRGSWSGIGRPSVASGPYLAFDQPSTLGQAAGHITTPRSRRKLLAWTMAGLGGIGLLGLAGELALRRRPQPAQGVSPPLATASDVRLVHWNLESEPSGADVMRDADGQRLCTTPCVYEQAAGRGRIKLRLHRDGYVDRIVQADQAVDMQRLETLDPLPIAPTTLATKRSAAGSKTAPASSVSSNPRTLPRKDPPSPAPILPSASSPKPPDERPRRKIED